MMTFLRNRLQRLMALTRVLVLRHVWGMTIGRDVRISGKAFLDFTHPNGLTIGDYTIITPGARIFTHDFVRNTMNHTRIGSHCFVGANALIMPGLTIGDHCVIAAGSVVLEDVPSHSLMAGNPARLVRSGITTGRFGMMADTARDLRGPPDPGGGA